MFDSDNKIASLKAHALNIRKQCLKLAFDSGTAAHLGGGLSLVEAVTCLYGDVMNTREKDLPYDKKDKFVLSKGHGVLGLYSALAEFGIIDRALLDTYMKDGSDLIAHPVMKPEIGLETSSGSLGQGVSLAVGLSLAAKKKGYTYQTYVVCGNGEFNEGSVWEACMSAVNFRLDNYTIFLDNNHMQSDGFSQNIMNVSDRYAGMLRALGFQVLEIDGNDMAQVYDAYHAPHEKGMPKIIVGNTVKGKGISFMENNNEWHHNRLTRDKFEAAMAELGGEQ